MLPTSKSQQPPSNWLEERQTASQPGFSGNDLLETRHPSGAAKGKSTRTGPPSRIRVAQAGLALIAGAFVGGAMLLAEPFSHRCGATLQLADPNNAAAREKLKTDLVAFLWGRDSQAGIRLNESNWLVDEPAPGALLLSLVTTDTELGTQKAKEAANEFITKVRQQIDREKDTPGEGESFLLSYVNVLTERLGDAQKQLDEAVARLPEADPRQDKSALVEKWREVRGDFDSARAQLASAAEEYRRLTDRGEITEAVVSPEKRQAAFNADQDLQQDMKELVVTLGELKEHVLTVGSDSNPALEQVSTAVTTGLTELKSREGEDSSESLREVYTSLNSQLAAYGQDAEAFAEFWNREFAAFSRALPSAENATLLDDYQRIKNALNDFLFKAGNRLSAMREAVNQISRDPSDDARHHLRQSDAARALAEVQSAHHRFEFSAGALDTTNNFRLDSTLRIARGLRRRVSDRIRTIDDALQKEAVARAREEQAQAMAVLDAIVRKSRDAGDATIDQLLKLQDELQTASTSSEQFVAAVAAAELANHRLQLSRKDLDQAQVRLRELAQRRADQHRASELTIASAGVVERNVNLGHRLRVGGIGAAVTFLAVLLGQIVLARALWPSSPPAA